jgi:hypothetical protein
VASVGVACDKLAACAIALAWSSDNSPERNAAAVSGNSSNRRSVSNHRDAAPTPVPVASANQCAAER